jgi:hypothetical protein
MYNSYVNDEAVWLLGFFFFLLKLVSFILLYFTTIKKFQKIDSRRSREFRLITVQTFGNMTKDTSPLLNGEVWTQGLELGMKVPITTWATRLLGF